MNMTTFLTKRAKGTYTTINELWRYAKEDFKIKPFKTKQEFLDLLGKYLKLRVKEKGIMPNGLAIYCELPFRPSQGSLRMGDRNVGMLKVGRPLPQES